MQTLFIKKKKLWLALAIGAGLILGILLITLCPHYWLSMVSSQVRLVPIYEVATKEQAVASALMPVGEQKILRLFLIYLMNTK